MYYQFSVLATVSHQFSASAEQVFNAWLDTQFMWFVFFGSKISDTEVVTMQSDSRVGGRFAYIARKNGLLRSHLGEYLEINCPNRLAFTWQTKGFEMPDSHIIIDIAVTSQGSELTLRQEMPQYWAEFIEEAQFAWTGLLNAFDQALEAQNFNPHG